MTDSGKLDLIITEIHGIKEDVEDMKGEIHILKEDMEGVKGEIHVLKEDMEDMKGEIHVLKEDVLDMKQEMQGMQQNLQDLNYAVTKTNLIIENELRVNLQRVAEGHLDLSRKLEEAKKPNEEVEVLSLKVRMLESNVNNLKEKFA